MTLSHHCTQPHRRPRRLCPARLGSADGAATIAEQPQSYDPVQDDQRSRRSLAGSWSAAPSPRARRNPKLA